MDQKDRITSIMRQKGPVIPVQIAKELSMDMIFASAHLSEMASNKKLIVTKGLKIGGSPLYYLPGQEYKLQEFIKHLNEKDRRVFEALKESKILRDSEQNPLTQVALRALKDFAVPLQVTHNNQQEIFWKFYLLSNDDAKRIIESTIRVDQKRETVPERKEEAKSEKREDRREEKKEDRKEERRDDRREERREDKREEKKDERAREDIREKTAAKEIRKEEERREEKVSDRKAERTRARPSERAREDARKEDVRREEQETVQGAVTHPFIDNTATDPFVKEVKDFFINNKITLSSINIVKKNSEADFLVEVPSVVGPLTYYCKAKNKRRVNEGDVSQAYVQGQLKKLPILLLTKGELTKKAKEMVDKELKGIVVKSI